MRLILFISLYFISVGVFSQSTADRLTRNWQVDWTSMETKMSISEKEKFTTMPDAVRERARISFSSRNYQFNNDGSVTIEWQGANNVLSDSGIWQINELEELVLQVGGQEHRYTVEFETDNILVLHILTAGSAASFSTIVLTPQ